MIICNDMHRWAKLNNLKILIGNFIILISRLPVLSTIRKMYITGLDIVTVSFSNRNETMSLEVEYPS